MADSMTGPGGPVLRVDRRRLLLDDAPVLLQGVSFFNALYNTAFNRDDSERRRWLSVFDEHGINLLRIWCQWDFPPSHPFVDVAPDHTLYRPDGDLRADRLDLLLDILRDAASAGMVVEVVLFSSEKGRENYFPANVQLRAARLAAEALVPFRNVILQIWNEESVEVAGTFDAVKSVDPDRVVSNSPGGAGVLGDDEQNRLLDILTPHTQRRGAGAFFEVAPRQVADLLAKFEKPVIDDEPARTGLMRHGGIDGGTEPVQHIAQIRDVRSVGGHHIYHHDMFQNGAGHPATPPSGIPEPQFSAFHRVVFDYLRDNPPARERPTSQGG